MGNKISSCSNEIALEDYANWYRLCSSLESCVKPALLDILHSGPKGLPRDQTQLNATLTNFKTTHVFLKNVIKDYQWDKMCHVCKKGCQNPCPSQGKTNSGNFDVTLIVVLIINMNILQPPTNGWRKEPPPNDNSKAANVLRARDLRNELNHSSFSIYNDTGLFKTIRSKIRDVLQGLGVTDFKLFDQIETASIDKQSITSNFFKFLEDKERESRLVKHQNVLQKEIATLKSKICQLNLKLKQVNTTNQTKDNKTTLKFHLLLDRTSEQFTEEDMKINGRLHRHIVNHLETLFKTTCQELSIPFEIIITEIIPVEEKLTPRLLFQCKVDSIDQVYVRENFRNSLQPKSVSIISNIEKELVASISHVFNINTSAVVRKWEYGSLLLDILINVDDSVLDVDKNALLNHVKTFLKGHLTIATNITVKAEPPEEYNKSPVSNYTVSVIGKLTMPGKDVINVKNCLEVFDHSIFEHAKINISSSSYVKTYHFNEKDAGRIIGKHGSEIKKLNQMPNIKSVRLDTKSSTVYCTLTIEAKNQEACQKVVNYIQKKKIKFMDFSRFPTEKQIFVERDSKYDDVIVLQLCDRLKEIPVLYPGGEDKIFYNIKGFKSSITMEEVFSQMSIKPTKDKAPDFQEFSRIDLEDTFQRALDLDIDMSENQLEFNMSPGKYLFFGNNEDPYKILKLNPDGSFHPASYGLKPIYQPFLNLCLKDQIFKKLEGNSYQCLTKNAPEAYTNVHLYVVDEKTRFRVRIALDKDLNKGEIESEDDRNKKKAIDRVFKAKTVGEVLEGDKSRIKFIELSRLLHPDKNVHSGATEAFMKMKHSYDTAKAASGDDWKFSQALDLDPSKIDRTTIPPKVISVKSDKKKICTITTFSKSTLDVRASLMTFTNNNPINEQIKAVLNNCWENRDSDGGIPTPDGDVNLYTWCIKQITAGHIWVKEITDEYGAVVVLEVAVNEIREKVENEKEWKECIEIDMNIKDRVYKKMSAQKFADNFLIVKNEWEKICPNL